MTAPSGSVAAPVPAARNPRLPYMPGVDGLRAIAVGAVLIYHLGAVWLPGGFLGVDVFLVISGYLITSLLLAERAATGRIDLKRFWLRRARRLLPAVFLMLIVVLAAMAVLHPGEVARLHGALLASIAYVANWYFVFAEVPYFEQFGRPSVLLHLWSLAVEEQFYLIWPPVLVLGLLAVRRPRRLVAPVIVLIAGSTALAWALWQPFADPSRIYYGTDTRAVALLVGVALALMWPAAQRVELTRSSARTALDGLGLVCLAAVLVAMLTLGDLDEVLYKGGFLALALATAGLIAVAAHPSSRLGRLLGTPVMVWIGLRSYGIYLWHWPVIMLTRPDVDIPLDGPALIALRLALTLGAAALSYRFVEVPFRRHGIRGLRDALGRWGERVGRPARVAAASSLGLALAALLLAVAFLPRSTPVVPGLTGVASAVEDSRAPETRPGAEAERLPPLLFVGDSVMLGASEELRRAFGPEAVVDAAVGRRFPEGAAVVQGRLRMMPRDAAVVIHLGNNAFVDPQHLDVLMRRLAARPQVVLLTVRVPLPWQDSVNEAVRGAPAPHDNVTVVDWHARSDGPGLLVDGAHMTPRGTSLYAATIAEALATSSPTTTEGA